MTVTMHRAAVDSLIRDAVVNAAGSLFKACVDGDAAYVELLIINGMSPNTCDYNRRTPLHLAASNGHTHIVHFLCNQAVGDNSQSPHSFCWAGTADARPFRLQATLSCSWQQHYTLPHSSALAMYVQTHEMAWLELAAMQNLVQLKLAFLSLPCSLQSHRHPLRRIKQSN